MNKILTTVFSLALLLFTWTAWAEPVDINTADQQTLAEAIKGVGEKRAEAIIAYRDSHGPFKSVDELTLVKGIGLKIVEKNRENLVVGSDKQE